MESPRNLAQEAAEDIFFGQLVIIYARWFVIVAMVVLALWSANTIDQLVVAVLFIVPLMVINFFVHGRYLMEKPANKMLLTILSVVDIMVITLPILFWPGAKGIESQFYIFYDPLVLAFAFVSVARNSIVYTIFTLALYGVVCFFFSGFAFNSLWLERLTIRVLTIGAMGVLGAYYWRIQRNRLRQATELEFEAI